MDPRARALIEELALQPHPEGGFYREIYRSGESVQPRDGRPPRSALTTIYFLLPAGAHSRWHRVSSDEVWHLYEGGSLELLIADPEMRNLQCIRLQAASATGGPVHTVPASWWQAARPAGSFALAGCTVGPGFDFADFAFLRDDARALSRLQQLEPAWAELA